MDEKVHNISPGYTLVFLIDDVEEEDSLVTVIVESMVTTSKDTAEKVAFDAMGLEFLRRDYRIPQDDVSWLNTAKTQPVDYEGMQEIMPILAPEQRTGVWMKAYDL